MAMLFVGMAHAEDVQKETFTMTEMGFGRFRAVDESGTEFLLHLAQRVTQLEPEDWQVHEGDKVYEEYWPSYRGRPNPTYTLIRLAEASSKSKALTNPFKGQIEEVGRGAVRVRKTVEGETHTFRFLMGRRQTSYVPVGWVPPPGERVTISYSTRPARFG